MPPGSLKWPLPAVWVALLCCTAAAQTNTPPQLAGWSPVSQASGKGAYVIPLSVRDGALETQGRHLLNHGALSPIRGAVRDGYFYAQLLLGTPPKTYSTIIDTGSSITYIPCAKCQHCGTHLATPFDPSQSSTARWLGCSDQKCQCGTPACSCREKICYYTRHYAEASSSEGWMVADRLHLAAPGGSGDGSGNSSRAVEVVFGCENVETGEIYRQRVDGVMGMGNNVNSLPHQLARAGVTENVFALCYGFPEGGTMLLGDVTLSPALNMQYTPFVATPHFYYTITTLSISLGGKQLAVDPAEFSKGYGTVLDSGTTFTYLPTPAYQAFLAAVRKAVGATQLQPAAGKEPGYNDICWAGAPADWAGIDKLFPSGNMSFAGGAHIELLPYRYLFKVDGGHYCLGVFDNGYQGTLLGGIITRNMFVQYDKEKNRAGFAHTDCNSIKPAEQAQEGGGGSAGEDHDQQHMQPSQQQQEAAEEEADQDEEEEDEGQQVGQDSQQGHTQDTQPDSQDEQQPASSGAARTSSSSSTNSSSGGTPAPAGAAAPAKQQQGGQQAAAQEQRAGKQDGSTTRQQLPVMHNKLLWLGLAVGAVLVLALVQLTYATLWQPPSGSAKAGSSGGLLSRALAINGQQRYQQLGASDDQELAEFSEGALKPHGARDSSSSQQV